MKRGHAITKGAAGYATLGVPAPTPAWLACTRAGVLLSAGVVLLWQNPALSSGSHGGQMSPEAAGMESSLVASIADRSPAPLAVHGNPSASALISSASRIFDSNAQITDRLDAVHRLGNDLTREQIADLYVFLKELPRPQ
jgi:hypothetical protein